MLKPVPMARHFNAEAAADSLKEILRAKAAEIREKYGPVLGWEQLQRLLQDRTLTPFPCEVCFDATPLLPGEFANAVPKGGSREEGYIIYLHPIYATQLEQVSYLVLHRLGLIHSDCATVDDAEMFGSVALGLSKDAYYRALCELSGQIGGDELM
jgi:hypothetical protein